MAPMQRAGIDRAQQALSFREGMYPAGPGLPRLRPVVPANAERRGAGSSARHPRVINAV